MTTSQIAALIVGPIAIVGGLLVIRFRNEISRMARDQRERQGKAIGPTTQSPQVQAIGGIVAIAAGAFLLIGGLTGFLR